MLVEVVVLLVAHLAVVVVVQRPRLRDVRQVLSEHTLGHRADLNSLSDALSALPLAQVIRQLFRQFLLKLCLTGICAFRRFEVIFVDIKGLQIHTLSN